jgi:glutamate synthase domain-containing protein 1
MLYLASEESAIRLISPDLDNTWSPEGGRPVVARLKADCRLVAAGEKATEL